MDDVTYLLRWLSADGPLYWWEHGREWTNLRQRATRYPTYRQAGMGMSATTDEGDAVRIVRVKPKVQP